MVEASLTGMASQPAEALTHSVAPVRPI